MQLAEEDIRDQLRDPLFWLDDVIINRGNCVEDKVRNAVQSGKVENGGGILKQTGWIEGAL
jgi:hypothetical protein